MPRNFKEFQEFGSFDAILGAAYKWLQAPMPVAGAA